LLRSWLAGTNGSDEGEKVASACAYLGIDDRFKIDGDVLESVRMIRMEDAKDDPSKQIEIQQHYEVLRDYLAGQFESLPQPDYENPVGLSNMGNTCYLNCLLQYFYTIRPLREVILDFDEYKIDTSASNYRPKKVDAQIISKIHVMRTQQCKSKSMTAISFRYLLSCSYRRTPFSLQWNGSCSRSSSGPNLAIGHADFRDWTNTTC
jgi:ubiquitin carboxyl-terminal hydrolase 25/28